MDVLINQASNRIWWSSASTDFPFVRNAIADMFAHICFENKDFSQKYIKDLFKMINTSDFMVVKKCERPLLRCLLIEDQYQRQRIVWTQTYLLEIFKKNTQFWKLCDQLIELTLKLASRCRAFAEDLLSEKKQDLFKTITQITNANPSFPLSNGKVKFFKDGNVNWQADEIRRLVSEKKVKSIEDYSKKRLDRLSKVLLKADETVDSDDDCFNYPFKPKDTVDVK